VSRFRVIARIDVKNEFVVKGKQMDGLRKLGDPNQFALRYYEADIDELLFVDVVVSIFLADCD
jgi:cyclase